MIFWVVILLVATNFWFAMFFLLNAVRFLDAGQYLMCAVDIMMTAINGGLGSSVLCKLLK